MTVTHSKENNLVKSAVVELLIVALLPLVIKGAATLIDNAMSYIGFNSDVASTAGEVVSDVLHHILPHENNFAEYDMVF